MRVLVCGGRDYHDVFALCRKLDELHLQNPIEVVIRGGAKGADTLAGAWGRSRGLRVFSCRADWEKHGKAAGPIRNQQMLDEGKPISWSPFPAVPAP